MREKSTRPAVLRDAAGETVRARDARGTSKLQVDTKCGDYSRSPSRPQGEQRRFSRFDV